MPTTITTGALTAAAFGRSTPSWTTWSPIDKSAEFTLSGGNLVATHSSALSWDSVRADSFLSSGMWYFEDTFTSGTFMMVGIGKSTASLTTWVGGDADGWGYSYDGSIFNNAIAGPTYPTYATGDTVCVAADLTNGLLWFRLNGAGNWNNSGTADPSTGTGGISIGAGTWAPMGSGFDTMVQTARFGAAGFVGAIPSNYRPWNT